MKNQKLNSGRSRSNRSHVSAAVGRRQFLQVASATGVTAMTPWNELVNGLGQVSAAESYLRDGDVDFDADIAPLVKLLEETPRDAVVEKVAQGITQGTWSYRQLLAGLFLAAVRNVQPRPSVGFKFHAVLVINSAHLASLNSPAQDRWLPLLWAVDQFKSSQARDEREGNWTMPKVDESSVPPSHRVVTEFREAMDAWDVDRVDGAAAGLARHATHNQAFELFANYAARDYRSIGHKVIFVANAFRTLEVIGWRYAEPILRSLAYALLNHEGDPNPSASDLDVDRPWRLTEKWAGGLPEDWQQGGNDEAETRSIVAALRDTPADASVEAMAARLGQGTSSRALSDALFLTASELLLRQPGIVGLHTLTTTNACQYLVRTVQDDQLRRRLQLQNAAFLPLFLASMRGRGEVSDRAFDRPASSKDLPSAIKDVGVGQLFEQLGSDKFSTVDTTRKWLVAGGNQRQLELIAEARRLVFLKGNDSHDYKLSSAIFEDVEYLSPRWRAAYLGNTMVQLRSSKEPTRGLVTRIHAALT